ncbi:MAG TPA: VOC family protein [Gemmataceae bacterium]|nr:VOC family protein [Gemmataceae bacterium]
MAKKVKPIPKGYHTATPYLIVAGAEQAIRFYKKAFGATELMRFPGPGGKLMHAEIQVGDSPIMLADESPEWDAKSPHAYGGTPVGMMLYVPDVDKTFKKAVAAGAKVAKPVQDQFYGDRSGTVIDPFGHKWTIGTHVEDVPSKEMQRRFRELMQKSGPG